MSGEDLSDVLALDGSSDGRAGDGRAGNTANWKVQGKDNRENEELARIDNDGENSGSRRGTRGLSIPRAGQTMLLIHKEFPRTGQRSNGVVEHQRYQAHVA